MTVAGGTVAQCTLQYSTTVGKFGCHLYGDYFVASSWIIGAAVLLTPQQDVARSGAEHASQKASVFGQKCKRDTTFSAQAHQWCAGGDLSKTDDRTQGVYRQAQTGFLFHPHQNGFPFTGQPGTLSGDVEGIEQFFHKSSIRCRYSLALPVSGRQRSRSEQWSHLGPGSAGGVRRDSHS